MLLFENKAQIILILTVILNVTHSAIPHKKATAKQDLNAKENTVKTWAKMYLHYYELIKGNAFKNELTKKKAIFNFNQLKVKLLDYVNENSAHNLPLLVKMVAQIQLDNQIKSKKVQPTSSGTFNSIPSITGFWGK